MARIGITWDEELHVRDLVSDGAGRTEIVEWLAGRGMHRSSARRWEWSIRDQMARDGLIRQSPRGLWPEGEDAGADYAPAGGHEE